jgi:hypothetical protein
MMVCNAAFAQQNKREPVEKIITDLMERYIENDEANVDYTDLQEQLEYYTRHKLNLNKAGRNQLQRLFFLDEGDINAIIMHKLQHGDFVSIYELQAIPRLDDMKLYYLSYFVEVEGNILDDQTPFLKKVFRGRHEVLLLHESEMQQRAGYNPERQLRGQSYYTGSPYRYLTRYRFNYSNVLYFGYTAEKDKGEPFFDNRLRGFDFNSFHFLYRPKRSIIKTIALGDYQANFGQGLTFGSGLAARKSAFVLSVKRNFQQLRPYRSLNENEFLRGAAVTLGKGNIEFTPFFSAKYISTNYREPVDEALLQEAQFSSIQLSGLHRTESELLNRNNVFQTIYGAHTAYTKKDNRIGFTYVSSSFDKAFVPGTAPYQLYNFSGRTQSNMGIDYAYRLRNASFFGEAARSSNNAYALTSGLIMPLDEKLDVIMLYRNFSPRYQAAFANPFAENSDARNEQGFYTGASIKFSRKWVLNTYYDMYASPWLRYLTEAPSRGYDFLSELQYNISRSTQIYFRYRHEEKWRNQSGNTERTDYLSPGTRTQYRLHAQYKLSLQWIAKSRVEHILYNDELLRHRTGTLIFQDVYYSTPRKRTSITARVAIFTVDDYNARIYATENDVLYQYAVPLYNNSGVRYYILIHQYITRKIDFWIKYALTDYSNIDRISSGLQQINGNRQGDLRVQLRFVL